MSALSCGLVLGGVLLAHSCAGDAARSGMVDRESVVDATHGRLLFADEFDGRSLDDARWTTCYWWQRDGGCRIASNDEQQWYQPDQVRVEGGALHLVAERRAVTASDGARYAYRSGMVSTGRTTSDRRRAPRFAFRYGYVEARLRVPAGQGLWPALWLLPVTHESRPEIDVLEVKGSSPDDLSMHLHTRDGDGRRQSVGQHWRGTDFSDGWHSVAIDWRPERLRWLVDGTEVWRVEGDRVPDEPLYLLANLAVGGSWVGPPADDTAFPSEYLLDYVRVWER